jgi:hypothetical protein
LKNQSGSASASGFALPDRTASALSPLPRARSFPARLSRLGACQLASRLKNNLLLSAEIGFVSLWRFMQAIKLKGKPGHERTWRPQQIA